MADDFSGVKSAYDKASYNAGDLITLTISGQAQASTTTTGSVGPLTLTLTDATGATGQLTVASQPVTMTSKAPEAVKVTAVADPNTARVWKIDATGLILTATA